VTEADNKKCSRRTLAYASNVLTTTAQIVTSHGSITASKFQLFTII